ncbi:MAG: class III signal peptide-containing protein [Candidatus Micrarchaeota archaeon]
MTKRGQGAFEYILLLAGVLLIVVLAIIILRGAVPGTQTQLAQCKAQVASVPVCINSTGAGAGLWYSDGCGATGCTYASTGVSAACENTFSGTPWDDGLNTGSQAPSWSGTADTDSILEFDCGSNPIQ